jgi:phosphate transport system ATP-binding protein
MSKRIEAKDLDIYYGKFKAVEGVSMIIEPRAVTAFIGPSGCGKSTFLRSLNRMHEVIPGAYVEGELCCSTARTCTPRRRPGERAPPDRHGVPAAQPVPHDVIKENVLAGRQAQQQAISSSEADALAEESLRGANLWDEVKNRLDLPGSGLSGGQQQRLCIARAIAMRPRCC